MSSILVGHVVRFLYLFVVFPTLLLAERCSLSAIRPVAINLGNCSTAGTAPSAVDSWGMLLEFGTPPQPLCVVPSTVVNNTLVMGTDVCGSNNNQGQSDTLAQCTSRRGGLLDIGLAGSSFAAVSPPSKILASDPAWGRIMAPSQNFTVAGTVPMLLPADMSLANMPIAVVTEGHNHSTGHLGLGNASVVLASAVSKGLIPEIAFGINAGSQSVMRPRPGNLVLGGYDSASVDGPFTNYDVSNLSGGRSCPLRVTIESLVLRRPGVSDVDLISDGDGVEACIEPYDNLFRLPQAAIQLFQYNTNWQVNGAQTPNEVINVEPGLLYPASASFNGTLVFNLNKNLQVEIPNYELQHPLRGIDANGKRVLVNNITEVNIFAIPAPLKTAVLGKVFLSQVYLGVNYGERRFKLSKVVQHDVAPMPVPFSSEGAISCEDDPTVNKLRVGIIVMGSIFGVFVLASLIYFWRRWRRPRSVKSVDTIPEPPGEGSVGTILELPQAVRLEYRHQLP